MEKGPELSSWNGHQTLVITSAGFELYLPPTPMINPLTKPPGRPRFVLLDDINDAFYDVDYETPNLKNTIPWKELLLHKVPDPAIVFPDNVHFTFQEAQHATGFLVSIESREGGIFYAKRLGAVHVHRLDQKYMNWAALSSLKGSELADEMKAGLLRRIWNRRPSDAIRSNTHVTQGSVLQDMRNPWHRDGTALNYDLDQQFAGGMLLGSEQQWQVFV